MHAVEIGRLCSPAQASSSLASVASPDDPAAPDGRCPGAALSPSGPRQQDAKVALHRAGAKGATAAMSGGVRERKSGEDHCDRVLERSRISLGVIPKLRRNARLKKAESVNPY